MAKRVNLVTWSLAVGKGKPQEFSWRVLSGTLTHKMKPVIPSIFISKAFLFSVEGRSRGNQAQNGWKRTFIYPFFSPFFICFHTGKSHASEKAKSRGGVSAFHNTTKLITLSAHAKVLFMVKCFISLLVFRCFLFN